MNLVRKLCADRFVSVYGLRDVINATLIDVPFDELIVNHSFGIQNFFKVFSTSVPIFEQIMKRYPIFSVQLINYHIA